MCGGCLSFNKISFNMNKVFFLILLVIGLIILCIRYIETWGIFFPKKEIEVYPSALNLAFEDVYITTEDGVRINGWFIPHTNARHTLLFFHGNAGNIEHRLDKILMLREAGVNIFIIDYRGFGKSEGRLTEEGFYLDANAAYNYLVDIRRIRPEEIILYGESLGAAVVIDLAAKVRVSAIIVEGAFSGGRDMAVKIYPFLPAFLFSNKFNSLKKIKKVKTPKLFIHSINDEIVPFALANKLYQAASGPKEIIELIGSHNTAFLDAKEKYVSSIRLFIEKL